MRVDTLLGKMVCWGKGHAGGATCGGEARRVRCTRITIPYNDSHQNASTSTSSQIYAEWLKKTFYGDIKYDPW